MPIFTDKEIKKISGEVASGIGRMLRQEYRKVDGAWWLFAMGKAQRPLDDEDVAWHVKRNHAPFVENGINTGDPKWWDDPVSEEKP